MVSGDIRTYMEISSLQQGHEVIEKILKLKYANLIVRSGSSVHAQPGYEIYLQVS
jgi:hypothetical protein